MIWKTLSSRVASRPATATNSIRASQPAIHSAALGLEGIRSIGGECHACRERAAGRWGEGRPVSATPRGFATRKYADAVLRRADFDAKGALNIYRDSGSGPSDH